MKEKIHYSFETDSHFAELKEAELLQNRANLLRDMDEYAGKYYSHKFVRNKILRQTEEEADQLDSEMNEEQNDPKYSNPEEDSMGGRY